MKLIGRLILSIFMLASSAPLFADIAFYVAWCKPGETDSRYVRSYNGKDGSCIEEYDETWVSPLSTNKMKCKGQGKGRCKYGVNGFSYCEGRIDKEDTLLIFKAGNKIQEKEEVDGKVNCCANILEDSDCKAAYDVCHTDGLSGKECLARIREFATLGAKKLTQ